MLINLSRVRVNLFDQIKLSYLRSKNNKCCLTKKNNFNKNNLDQI